MFLLDGQCQWNEFAGRGCFLEGIFDILWYIQIHYPCSVFLGEVDRNFEGGVIDMQPSEVLLFPNELS